MDYFRTGAYWGGRRESAEASARRVVSLFKQLGQCDTAYARWFAYAYSRKHSLGLPFEPNLETFRGFFARRKYRLERDIYTFDAWTGQEKQGRGGMMNFTCGSDNPFYPNGCMLHMPREEPAASRVLTIPVLKEVMRAMVRAWDADGCAVVPEDDQAAKKAVENGRPCLGWLTYIASRRGGVPPLPAPVHIEPMEKQGTLIILTPEPFSVNNPEHVSLAGSVREQLEKAGLLPPPGE